MCMMTTTGFRWYDTIPVPVVAAKWYVFERYGEPRYSRTPAMGKPLYAINVYAKDARDHPCLKA